MWRMTLRTLRGRAGANLASAAVILAGTALLTGLAALLETGLAIDGPDASTLTILACILGGWSVAIVVFGVMSTVGLTVQQREREIALLRAIGATPGQVRRSVLIETVAIAIPVVAVGVVVGMGLGNLVLGSLIDNAVVSSAIELRVGGIAIGGGALVSVLATSAASTLAGRRAATIAPIRALAEAGAQATSPASKVRLISGLAVLGIGVSLGVTTLFMPNGPLLSSTAGPAGVAAAAGLALLGPWFVPLVGAVVRRMLGRGMARLAGNNLGAQPRLVATIAGPLVLLVGIATGTLYMQSTEDSIYGQGGGDGTAAQISSVNYLVVTMIIVFSAIAVVNTLIAATRRRRREFGLLRLTAASRRQVLGMVMIETVATGVLAIVLGSMAAAVTTVPFSLVKTGSPLPSGSIWVYLSILGGTLGIALLATIPTARRALRVRPVVAAQAT